MNDEYFNFIEKKTQSANMYGFEPTYLPDSLFDFQADMVTWALRKGRSLLAEDCGLGKTFQEMVWSESVVRKTNKPVLNLTPLAVSYQTVKEAEKFGIEAKRTSDGTVHKGINVTNYERLHYYNPDDFSGVVCDESSILKSFDGAYKGQITEFMRKVPYRLLATATAAPNDYIELGTSAEALGELGYMDMLNRFFKNDLNNSASGRMRGEVIKWRLKGHAETPFWRWVCSWARAIRKPSDLGYDDAKFILPPLLEVEHFVETNTPADGYLFALPAHGLKEQREERRRTIQERCEAAASLANDSKKPSLVWCHLNDEGDALESLIKDCVQVSGSDSDEAKEEKLLAFANGQIPKLITKHKIGAWGLNFQHCAHIIEFPSNSFEQHYQGIRRCYRFGQKNTVTVDTVTTEGQRGIVKNMQRKAEQADHMFSNLVAEMNNAVRIDRSHSFTTKTEVPKWL